MEINTTIIAAIVAAVAAIIAPVLTAWINNNHQYRMKKLEILHSQRFHVIQEFTASCSNHLAACNRSTRDAYYKSYGEIYLYVDKKHWKDIELLHASVESGDFQSASKRLAVVSQALASDMKI